MKTSGFRTPRRALTALVLLLALALLIAACGDDSDDGADPGDDDAAEDTDAATDETEDTESGDDTGETDDAGDDAAGGSDDDVEELVIAVSALGTGGIVDPILGNLDDKPYGRLVYTFLFDTDLADAELSEKTSLAESWEWNEDQTELTINIREGVIFHNGAELTAEDVAFNFGRLEDPENRMPYVDTILEVLDDVEVLDDYTLVLHLSEPSLEFELALSPIIGGSEGFMIPKAYFEEVGVDGFRAEPVGTGPYKIVDVDVGSHLELEAHEEYFLGRPSIDRIRIEVTPELSTRLSQLQTGEVDIAVVSREVAQDLDDEGFNLHTKAGGDIVALNPHVWDDETALNDMDVREALFTAINYEDINEFLLAGQGILTNNYIFEDAALGGEPIPPYEYDPERARELLEGAGYEDGELEITLYAATKVSVPEIPDIGQALADYWSEIGVVTDVVVEDYGTFRPAMTDRELDHPSLRIHSVDSRAINGPLLGNIFGCPEGIAWAMCPPGEYAEILEDLGQASNLEDYGSLQQQAAEAIAETHSNSVLAVVSPVYASNDKVTDWDLGATAYDVNYKYIAIKHLLE